MSEKGQEILTVEEMRQILKIGTNSAYNLIHSGAFPVIRIGQTYRIPQDPFTRGWQIPAPRYIRSNLQSHLNWRFYHGKKTRKW